MERDRWLERNLRGMKGAFGAFVRSAEGEVIEPNGVFAGVNPRVPERSIFNSVVYEDEAKLVAAYDELAAVYADCGCAWTVWVPEGDRRAAALLENAGHTLDAAPRAMGMELDAFEAPEVGGIDWARTIDIEAAALLNDRVYGYPEGTWIRGCGREPEGLITYVARLDGRPASTVAARHADGDCSIWSVATAGWARGRGLANALMCLALEEGSEAGCTTTTLQATKLGAPVYAKIGYRDFGALQMWEQRPAELAHEARPFDHAQPPQG
ncbi:MAG: GNAT family N-acetyltransferase [Solirubrobacterales bacterium]